MFKTILAAGFAFGIAGAALADGEGTFTVKELATPASSMARPAVQAPVPMQAASFSFNAGLNGNG